jgi:hypothetical protein
MGSPIMLTCYARDPASRAPHPLWDIPELRDAIFRHLDLGALSAAVRVCRAWFAPAVAVLWRAPAEFHHVHVPPHRRHLYEAAIRQLELYHPEPDADDDTVDDVDLSNENSGARLLTTSRHGAFQHRIHYAIINANACGRRLTAPKPTCCWRCSSAAGRACRA